MPSTYIQRTPSGGNRKKWTWSAWIKLSDVVSTNRYLWSGYSASNNTGYLQAYFHNDSQLNIGAWDVTYLNTTRVFRDPFAWYHIVIVLDTAQATAANRLKLYVNGVEETVFDTDSRSSISQDSDMGYNSNGIHTIGGYQSSGSANAGFDGYMSHVHFTDGYAYTPSAFGETDSATGEWKIKTSPSVSYGTTGYWIFKNDAGVSDQSPNSNNWTATGLLRAVEECPSNIFDTFNPLSTVANDPTLERGNTKCTSTTGNHWRSANCSIGMSSGKYYFETKFGTISGGNYCRAGIASENLVGTTTSNKFQGNYAYGINWDGSKLINSTLTGGYTTVATGDIFGFAVDLDNNYIYVSKNGSWIGSGDPTSGSSGTGALSAIQSGQMYFISASVYQSTVELNAGNGLFGSIAITSEGTNASNVGKFEYDVPTGYTALSTKGLNL